VRIPRPALAAVAIGCGIILAVVVHRAGRSETTRRATTQFPDAERSRQTARGSQPLPRPVRLQAPDEYPTDPRSPAYNAAALGQTGHRVNELYDVEPRAEEWAAAVERTLTDTLRADLELVASAKNLVVECHTQTCKLSVTVASADQDGATALLQLPAKGEVSTPGSPTQHESGDTTVTQYVAISMPGDDYERWLESQRAAFFDRLRAARDEHPPSARSPLDELFLELLEQQK